MVVVEVIGQWSEILVFTDKQTVGKHIFHTLNHLPQNQILNQFDTPTLLLVLGVIVSIRVKNETNPSSLWVRAGRVLDTPERLNPV